MKAKSTEARRNTGKVKRFLGAIGFVLLVATVLLAAAYARLIPGFGWYHDRQFTESVTGVAFEFRQPQYFYESNRGSDGSGWSVAAYKIPDHIIDRFQSDGVPSGPKGPMHAMDWIDTETTVKNWTRGPTTRADAWHVEFIFPDHLFNRWGHLTEAPEDRTDPASWICAKARRALAADSCFYAYFQLEGVDADGFDTDSVDIYIIDLQNGTFITGNHIIIWRNRIAR